jgi:hypothetical protein
MLAETGGGLMHRPVDAGHLAERLHELLSSRELKQQLAQSGSEQVRAKRNAQVMAERTLVVLRRTINTPDRIV